MKIMQLVLHKFSQGMCLTKHINPKFFYVHELQKMNEVRILHTKSCDNLADLFTKSIPASSFERCIHGIGMRRLREMPDSGGDSSHPHLWISIRMIEYSTWCWVDCTLFPLCEFSLMFLTSRFLMRQFVQHQETYSMSSSFIYFSHWVFHSF